MARVETYGSRYSEDIHDIVSVGNYRLPKSQTSNIKASMTWQYLQPIAPTPATQLSNPIVTEFDLRQLASGQDLIEALYLQFKLTNLDAVNPITVANPFLLMGQVQLLIGSTVVYTADGISLWHKYVAQLSSEDKIRQFASLNLDPATNLPIQIAASGSFNYTVPLDVFVVGCPFPIGYGNIHTRLLINWNSGPQVMQAGLVSNVSFTGYQLRCLGLRIAPSAKETFYDQYLKGPVTFRMVDARFSQYLTPLQMVGGVAYKQVIPVVASAVMIQPSLHDTTAVGNAIQQSYAITALDILTPSGQSVFGCDANGINTTDLINMIDAKMFPYTTPVAGDPQYHLQFGFKPEKALDDEGGYGSYQLSSLESIQYVPGANHANARLHLTIWSNVQLTVDFSSGVVEVIS